MSRVVKRSASQAVKSGPSRRGAALPPFVPPQLSQPARMAMFAALLGAVEQAVRVADSAAPSAIKPARPFTDWYADLPQVSRDRRYSMSEIEAELKTQGKYLSAVLLELRWRRKRISSTTGQYHRYWEPPAPLPISARALERRQSKEGGELRPLAKVLMSWIVARIAEAVTGSRNKAICSAFTRLQGAKRVHPMEAADEPSFASCLDCDVVRESGRCAIDSSPSARAKRHDGRSGKAHQGYDRVRLVVAAAESNGEVQGDPPAT
jgi:hypothetical protein